MTPVMNDFLNLCTHDSPVYAKNLQVIKDTCSRLNIPLALEKIEGPSQSLTFSRITLDITLMQALLPDNKLNQLRNEVAAWLFCKKEVKRLILSIGLLQHATKAVRQGEHLALECIKQQLNLKVVPHYKTYCRLLVRLEIVALLCRPLEWYHPRVLYCFRCIRFLGGRSVFGFQWMQLAWPKEYTQKDIVAKELLPIVSSCAVWDHYCQAAMWNSNVIPSRLWTQSTSVHFRSP